MSNSYTPTTNFGAKDSLSASDPNKVVRGSEFTTEFDAIASAFSASAPKASPNFTGTATAETLSATNVTATDVTSTDVTATDMTTTDVTVTGTATLPGISSDAVDCVINDGGFDYDFRVESFGVQNALLVQGSDGNVGVGDATPDVALSVTRGANAAIQIAAANLSDGDENVVTASTSATSADFRYGQIGSYKSASNTHTAGFLRLDSQVGVINYLWVDDNAQLRISPTKAHIGTNNGTVVISDGGTAANLVVSDHLSIGNTETPTSITATGLDDLIVGDLGSDGGVVVLSSDVGAGAYSFLDAASGNPAGRIIYQHSTDEMSIAVGGFSRVRMTGTGQFAVCRSVDAPQADDKFYVGTTSDSQSATVSGRNAGTNAYVRIDTSAARQNGLVFETNGTAAFTLERGDSDDADATSLYLHPGGPDGGASSNMKMASDGAVTFQQTLTAARLSTTSGSFTAASTGSTTETVSVPDGTYLVSVLADGAANIEISTTAIVHSRTTMVSGVTVLANDSFGGNATCTIQPKDNASAFTLDATRENLFDIVITNTLGATTIPVTYNIVRIG